VLSFRKLRLVAIFVCAALPAATRSGQNHAQAKESASIAVAESSDDLRESMQEKPPLQFGAERKPSLTITVDDAVRYQQIDGFGASLTDASAWLLSHKLTDAQRKDALEMLFSPTKGIGLSMLRQPMGSSDFAAVDDYSYDDMPPGQNDPSLAHFSIDRDRQYIIPILREALAINPKIKIIGSPWSPPGWMKTSGSMIYGGLLPSSYAPLANYFVRYIKAYDAAGVPIYAITMQNEPLHLPHDYPGMDIMPQEQITFLRDHLGPALRNAGLKQKIMIFDHNWDLIDYPITVLSDPQAAAFAAGIAIHCYGGSVTGQTELHNRFPNKDIWLTECSGGDWVKTRPLEQPVRLVIGATRNWAKSVILWNLALDQNHNPHVGGCNDCRGVITVDHSATPAKIIPTADFSALGHASKFVVPGAERIDSNSFEQGSLEDVAFRNPDGSIVLIVLNSSGQTTAFNIAWKNKYASYKLTAGAVATFRWSSSGDAR
jgi:glucosylceramidase